MPHHHPPQRKGSQNQNQPTKGANPQQSQALPESSIPSSSPTGNIPPQIRHVRLPLQSNLFPGEISSQWYEQKKHVLTTTPPLTFEVILLFHGLLFYFLQILHLYRTVWWLPQSFVTGAVHFHLISPHLTAIVITLLGKKVLYMTLKKYVARGRMSDLLLKVAIVGLVFGIVGYNALNLSGKGSDGGNGMTWLYLIGPSPVIYLHLYGLNISPFLSPGEESPSTSYSPSENLLANNPDRRISFPTHVCSNNERFFREECELLVKVFNSRMKTVFFNCFFISYYSCFLPWGFGQLYSHYDLVFVTQHLILGFMYLFSLLSCQAFCPLVTDQMHKVALHLTHPPETTDTQSPRDVQNSGTIVRFCNLFSSSTFPRLILGYHLAVELLTFIILLKSSEWYQIISITALLVTSTLPLIRLGRDFFVVMHLYRAEKDFLLK